MATGSPRTYLTDIIEQDLGSGRFDHVQTRFAPEPNAYLHIGHALSIAMTYGAAERFGGLYSLRFDDTNPCREKAEYVEAIREDIRWLGYDWGDREFHASDYFEQLYAWALLLIRKGKAYVCDLSEDEIAEYRGTNAFDPDGKRLTPRGKDSPWRERGVEENLDLFGRMRAGEFPDGARTLRARIDMGHDNLTMRDPIMYRIRHVEHHRIGRAWCIYPAYDWAHGQSDSLEGVTHSICGMEWRHHRELYDWFISELGIRHPRQIEYPRIRLGHTVTSKRLLVPLVEGGHVAGWDDPRMPTIRGLRRRGIPREVIRDFTARIGIVDNKREIPVEMSFFEHCVRECLNATAPRTMAVIDPLRLVIEDEPDAERMIEAPINPEDPGAGSRAVSFSRELCIERDDFMVEAVPGFRRLVLGGTVRLRYAGEVTCHKAVVDHTGVITELRCTWASGSPAAGRRSIIHWVSARSSVQAEVRLYESLFSRENPLEGAEGDAWLRDLNPKSLTVVRGCRVEPEVAAKPPGYRCQFERIGYFCVDPDSAPDRPVLNRIVPLKDRWEKARPKAGRPAAAPQAPLGRSRTKAASRSMESAAKAAPVPKAADAPRVL